MSDNKYSVWAGEQWLWDIHAPDADKALEAAKAQDPAVTHVNLVSSVD